MPTIETTIMKVERDGNWVRIHTDHPQIQRLDTRDADKAREAFELAASGERVVVQYTSRPRTLEDGRTFQNYYYDSAMTASNGGGGEAQATLDDIPAAAAPATSGGGEFNRKTNPEDAWRISLAAGAKLAVGTLPLLERAEDKTFEAQTRLAYAWAKWLVSTPRPGGEAYDELDAIGF